MNREPEKSSFKDLLYIATALLLIVGIVIYRSVDSKENTSVVVAVAEGVEAPQTANSTLDKSTKDEDAGVTAGKLNLENFRELTRTALEKLVPIKQFKDLQSQELHSMPEIMQESGVLLGQIAQALHDNPALQSEANSFYEDCFRQKDLPNQIRGLCLANHRNLRLKIGESGDWTSVEGEMPAEVIRLAGFIPVH